MKKLVIFGTQAFADLAHYYFTHDSGYTVAAFTVDAAYLREPTCNGLPVVPFERVEHDFPPAEFEMFVAVGIRKVNAVRAAKVAAAEAKGYRLASFVSSRAWVAADLRVGPNSMVMEQVGMHPFVTVGRDAVVWSATRVGFRTRIGDHCWVVSALFGESVTVGESTFVGLGATVAPGVTLGRSNVIGAGALILHDTRDFEVYRGHASTPARAPSTRLWGFGR